jgi:hypothetical protein
LVLAEIDLDDFGIGAGEAINWVKLFPTPTGDDPADFTVVGAINNGDAPIPVIPVPAGLPLLLGALGGLALIRRHQKS